MLKKTIEFTDFNGVERKEDYYFNLTKAELIKMELGVKGGLAEKIQRITNEQDAPAIMEFFEELILKSYGKKSEDGKSFIKTDAIREEFKNSAAYDVLFMEMVTDETKGSEFITGIIPAELAVELAKSNANVAALPGAAN